MAADGVVIEHPNRDKAGSQSTKAIVVALVVASAVVLGIVALGGWDTLQGAKLPLIAYILIYLVLAYYISRWRSGMLPVVAALAIILFIFAAVSAPEWFARDKDGFSDPPLDEGILGLLTLVLLPLQVLIIAFAMRGFSQHWHVEVERHPDGTTRTAALA